jgi:uncharacterized membrane protein YgcG
MRRTASPLAGVIVLAAAALGALAADARAEVPQPPVPPLPPTPVQVPTLPELPRVPQPAPPRVPSVPRVPAAPAVPATPPAPTVAGSSGGQGGGGSPPSGSSGGPGGGSYGSGTGSPPSGGAGFARPANPPVRVVRVAPTRQWIARSGRGALRKTTLTVVLSAPGTVVFELVRVAPDCAVAGRFRISGRRGVNRVPFRGRVRGRALPPGTYRIRAYVRGRAVAQTRIVIFDRRPLPGEVAAARSSNACAREDSRGVTSSAGSAADKSGGSASGNGASDVLRIEPRTERAGAGSHDRGRLAAGVLGARFERATAAVKDVHPLLFLLLGFAIALLTLATVPLRYVPNARVAALLAYRRSALALTGAMMLTWVMVFYALA